jgi:CRISPR-associated protein Cmr3
MWTAPADALCLEGGNTMHRMSPVPPRLLTISRDDDEAREALWVPLLYAAAKPLRSPRWWTEERFVSWLIERDVPAIDRDHAFDTYRRVQTRVGIEPETLISLDDVLFSHDVLETLEHRINSDRIRHYEWGIGVEAVVPDSGLPQMAMLGSDGRLASVELLPSQVFAPPDALLDAVNKRPCRGMRVVVVSPASFKRGWLPDGFEAINNEFRGSLPGVEGEVTLRSAMVPRPMHIGGWDMARRQPKRVARMVSPGAVYFFERNTPFKAPEINALWLSALGARTDEGFGRIVPGMWALPKER